MCALHFLIRVLLLVTCVFRRSLCDVTEPKVCPHVAPIANVDHQRLMGLWYQVANYGHVDESCVAISIVPGQYHFHVARFSVYQEMPQGKMVKGTGRYLHDIAHPHFDMWLHRPCPECLAEDIRDMQTVATDYDSFSIIYMCEDVSPTASEACGNSTVCSTRRMWLLSRNGDPVSKTKYNKLVSNVLGMHKPNLEPIDQFGCPPMPDFMYNTEARDGYIA